MTTESNRKISAISVAAVLYACLTAAAVAQAPGPPAPAIATLTTVAVTQRGNPPTGPHAVIVEHDSGLATHTIYRPQTLGNSKHPVLVWGEGGCAKNGLMFTEFLAEIASHGFVVIADGPPGTPGAGAGGPNGPAAGGGGAPPRAGAGGPGGPGGVMSLQPDGTDLVKAIDWLERENAKPGSRFRNKVDVARVAAMGMSCGGLMSYGASADPRVATVGIWNSGLIEPNQKVFDGLHSSVIIVTGGESDIAYANGKRDFETLPVKVPVFHGVFPAVGHGGTYNEDNGGAYGVAAVAWLKWQLQGDKGASGRSYFTGANCTLCKDANWVTQSRALP